MGVSIFGGGEAGDRKISHDKFYIDHKFKTLSANLALKLNKSGDQMTGDLKFLLSHDKLRTFGVTDIKTGQSVSLLLGDQLNQIRHSFGHSLKIDTQHGLKIISPHGEMLQIGTQNNASAIFFSDVIMRDFSIKELRDPVDDQDAATKRYVDTMCVKNSVGYIPDLFTNDRNKAGFVVTASSELGLNFAYNAFCSIGPWVSETKTNFWIQIECPEPVRIHKIGLRGVSMSTIKNWLLQASNVNDNWQNLFEIYQDSIDHTQVTTVDVDSYRKYTRYRIFINDIEGEQGGLSYWQLYTVDSLV